MATELNLRLLGGLLLTQNGAPLGPFLSQKVPALLAYLAVTGRPHSREALAGLLWGELPETDAKNNLRQALSNLRKLAEPYLTIDRETVEFNRAAPHFLDVAIFEQKARTETVAELQTAAELYAGDFLAGLAVRDAPDFEEWMLVQKARLRETALHVWQTLTHHHLTHGAYRAAIEAANHLLALDAWREEAHRQLMWALARSGQRSAALAQYETCRRILQKELGVEPSTETQALYQRLRAAGESVPHNLPPQPTSFVGRKAELMQLEALLLKPECRLITLLGAGGAGKTRLALEAAESAYQHGLFLNGVFFVPLAGVQTVEALAPAIAEACGLSFSGPTELPEQIEAHWRAQEALLVLDNFEHLVEASRWLGQLLKVAPNLKLLVTSREKLNVQWEWVLPMRGLDATSAPQLFVERARRLRPDFEADANAPAITRVCQLVEGLPLGLELAAVWAQTHTCAEIAREIERGYEFLATSLRDVPERQRSLRAVFDYSWQRLTHEQRAVCQRLAVFRGGFTRTAAAAVAEATPQILAALVEQAWLQHEAEGRFDIHELLRQYAADRLAEAGATAHAQEKHAHHQLEFAQRAAAEFHTPQQAQWLQQLEMEHNNLRAALSWLEQTRAAESFAQLCGALWPFWYLRSHLSEARRWLEAALAQAAGLPTRLRANLLRGAGAIAILQAEHARAIALLEENLALQRELNEPALLARALNSLAVALHAQGHFVRAGQLWEECLPIQRASEDKVGLAQTLQNLGALAADNGDFMRAEAVCTEGLQLFRELGLDWGIAWISINLGLAAFHRGDTARVRECAKESLRLCQAMGSQDGLAEDLELLAGVAPTEQAAQLLGAATAVRAAVGAPRSVSSAAFYERLHSQLQMQLGASAFQAAWQTGQKLTVEEAIALAQHV